MMRSSFGHRLSLRYCVAVFAVGLSISAVPRSTLGQNVASVAFGGSRPFVTSVTPVIGANGAVGGIEVDAAGVVRQARIVRGQDALLERPQKFDRSADGADRVGPLRKISLSKLEAAIAACASSGRRITEEMYFLANLLRIEYVLVYPEEHDIVIAGPACDETVVVDDTVVDAATGRPVLRLDDFVDALQSLDVAVAGGRILCSIDPTPEGTKRLQTLLNRRLRHSDATLRRMERQLGTQVITLGGIRPESHFARVLVGADYTMKRLAMGLSPTPIDAVPSYLSMLKRSPGRSTTASPRFWLTPHYDLVERSEDGLAWRLRGPGLRANTEAGHVNARGELVSDGKSSPVGQQWADQFSEHYSELSGVLPIFGQLSGCVDAAVLAALIHQQDLRMKAGCPLPLLSDADKLVGETYRVPTSVPSIASATRTGGAWIVSVSGGVEIQPSAVLDEVRFEPSLADARQRHWSGLGHWWWDD